MEFLRILEQLRTPVGDAMMSAVTLFGEETLFMTVALIFFWCLDKKRGYYLLFCGFVGTVCIQILKMSFRIPRPWVLDTTFHPVEGSVDAATGYSFPSGHTQCATDLYGGIARSAKQRILQIGGIVLCLLVAFSRMYLGVHTPLDVGVSLLIGGVLVFLFYPLIYRAYERPKQKYITIAAILVLTLANLLFVSLYPFPANVDPVNLADAQKVAWQMFAIILGMCFIYPIDANYLRFEVKAVWWAQILKLICGIALILAVRILLKEPFNALLGVHLGSALRYFLIVIIAGVLWPMTFPFWHRLGNKQ